MPLITTDSTSGKCPASLFLRILTRLVTIILTFPTWFWNIVSKQREAGKTCLLDEGQGKPRFWNSIHDSQHWDGDYNIVFRSFIMFSSPLPPFFLLSFSGFFHFIFPEERHTPETTHETRAEDIRPTLLPPPPAKRLHPPPSSCTFRL